MSGVPSRASVTTELVLEPQVRKFAERRWFVGALAIPLLLVLAYLAVVRLASLEQMLVADASHASRAVLYELPRASVLAAPIDPGTEIIRLAMHAYVRDAELPLGKRTTKLHVVATGALGKRVEDLTVDVPGDRTRVTSDEPGLSIGDPVAVDFDVHDLGAGELDVTIVDIDHADGLLVRMYRRESLSASQASARDSVLDRARKNHLARWTWELAWDEASASEQEEILSDRWRRVGALRGSGHDLRSVAVALVPRVAEARTRHADDSLGGVTLRGDERLAFVVRGAATLHVTSDLAATLKAVVKDLHGGVRTVQASGELTINTTAGGSEGVEVGSDRDVLINVRSTEAQQVDWYGFTQTWRATAATPVVIESPEAERLLRITARRPVERADAQAVAIEAQVEVSGPSVRPSIRRTLRATRARSRYDRYQGFDPSQAPTERFTFYVEVPRGGRATIGPVGEESLDLAMSEFDDSTPPEELAGRAVDEAPPQLEALGTSDWDGFVARRPSNGDRFDADHRPIVRVARHFVSLGPPGPPVLARFAASGGPTTRESDGRTFERAPGRFRGEVPAHRPALVPLRLLGRPGTRLQLSLTAGQRRAGVYDRVTLPRIVSIGPGPTRATLVIGDDIPPGQVTLDVTHGGPAGEAPAPSVTWIHLPRQRRAPSPPRWIAGQFEE